MRTNALSLSALASALLLAASAASISGCGKPAGKPELLEPPHPVRVEVGYDTNLNTAKMVGLGPDKKSILRKDKDWMEWSSSAGCVHVTFKGESPFDSLPGCDDKNVLKSGPAKKKGSFLYEAELWLDSTGTKRVRIDPIIEVMD